MIMTVIVTLSWHIEIQRRAIRNMAAIKDTRQIQVVVVLIISVSVPAKHVSECLHLVRSMRSIMLRQFQSRLSSIFVSKLWQISYFRSQIHSRACTLITKLGYTALTMRCKACLVNVTEVMGVKCCWSVTTCMQSSASYCYYNTLFAACHQNSSHQCAKIAAKLMLYHCVTLVHCLETANTSSNFDSYLSTFYM